MTQNKGNLQRLEACNKPNEKNLNVAYDDSQKKTLEEKRRYILLQFDTAANSIDERDVFFRK